MSHGRRKHRCFAALTAVINALTDAIGADIQMPATASKVWAALRAAGPAMAAE